MDKDRILKAAENHIKQLFSGEGTGHDYFHIERVVVNSKKIAENENSDLFLVELAARLHDLGDYKLNDGKDRSEEQITEFLKTQNADSELISKMVEIVSQVSFSKGEKAVSIEAQIVQDADRLDAMGAIGIARCFAYGGKKEREIWNPENPADTSLQHFYDKLLKLKELMNTQTGRKMAEERHQFLEEFLKRFLDEWNSE
ncbi:MAG: HD domain-containing protein [Flavobacteriia bacterium]|nr:HD domain-containing protein [Flavobacteriia bacterium]